MLRGNTVRLQFSLILILPILASTPAHADEVDDALFLSGRFEEISKRASIAIKKNPNNAMAYLSRGRAGICNINHIQEGIADCSRAIELAPACSSAYNYRAWGYLLLGNKQKSLTDLEKCINLGKTNESEARNIVAYIYFREDNARKSLEVLNEQLAMIPNDYYAHLQSAWINFDLKKYDKAISDCSAAIALRPRDAGAYIERGQIYAGAHQYSLSVKDFVQAEKLDGHGQLTLVNLGCSQIEAGSPKQGWSTMQTGCARKVAEEVNDWASLSENLARLNRQVRTWNRVISLNPAKYLSILPYANCCSSYESLGDRASALNVIDKALAVPTFTRDQLESLKKLRSATDFHFDVSL
jgi:tetratricopeptide (TPR) repeat protein